MDTIVRGHRSGIDDTRKKYLPQKPVSSPTEKDELSVLKAAECDTGPVEVSITCLVFIV